MAFVDVLVAIASLHLKKTRSEDIEKAVNNLIKRALAEHISVKVKALPPKQGPAKIIKEIVWIDEIENEAFSTLSQALGPRGLMILSISNASKCRIELRGRGSLANAKKEAAARTQKGSEHLALPLHFEVICEDSANRAEICIQAAVQNLRAVLSPKNAVLRKKELQIYKVLRGPGQNPNFINIAPPLPAQSLVPSLTFGDFVPPRFKKTSLKRL